MTILTMISTLAAAAAAATTRWVSLVLWAKFTAKNFAKGITEYFFFVLYMYIHTYR